MKLNSITYKNRNTPIFDWQNHFCCDSNAMGNIERQERHNRSGVKFDDLTYRYQKDGDGNLQRNRLYHVNDAIASSLDSTDIDDMGAFVSAVNQINTDNNYSYDAEGRLVKDKQEEIDTILWTVTGKVREIHRTDTSKKKNLVFDYDAFGRRIAKHVYNNETSMLEKSTYYILDASGNQLSIYEHRIDTANNAATYYLTERNIYGSSRLGVVNDTVNLFVPTLLPSYGIVGNRTYELSNHLGNVLTVINDIKYPVSDDNVSISGFEVGIAGISDYSPFGAPLDGRTVGSLSRYGFGNHEKLDEVKGQGNWYSFGEYGYDPRIVQRPTRDNVVKPWESPYVTFNDSPVYFADPDGNDGIITIKGNTITVSAKIHIYNGGKNKIDIAKAQKAIMKYWGKEDFKYIDGDKTYNVKFDIQVDEYTDSKDLKYSANENFVHPQDNGYRSVVRNNFFGEWAKDRDDATYAHEVGHFLGLADQYTDAEYDAEYDRINFGGNVRGKIFSINYENVLDDELMGATKGTKFYGKEKVSQRDIDAIVKYALDKSKGEDGKVVINLKALINSKNRNGLGGPTNSDIIDTAEKLQKKHKKMVTPHSK